MSLRFCSSSNAAASCVTSLSSNGISFWERNSFVRLQNIQPGWLKTTTFFVIGYLVRMDRTSRFGNQGILRFSRCLTVRSAARKHLGVIALHISPPPK